MAGMEVDSPPAQSAAMPPRDRIQQRLALLGVPQDRLDLSEPGLVAFVRENKSLIPEIVSSILPTDAEVSKARRASKKDSSGAEGSLRTKDLLGESLLWLQWLMFDGDPQATLASLAQKAAGRHAVCGAVWGRNDLAYHCRTCEHDSTCAICVPCFQNSDHKGHDYFIKYTGGGCCDCGDETAWKREGFCSKHKGAEQIQPLSEDLANSTGPVLDALLVRWKEKASLAEHGRSEREGYGSDVYGLVANELTSAVVEMLLDFCNCTESLLSFISRRMFECIGLLEVLARAERFLDKKVARKLHELLLKLLGEPLFKYELAKVFVEYYPSAVNEIIKECSDSMLEKYPMISTFSVQIFTVPSLTPRFVQEVNLLGTLLGCLGDLFLSCTEDGSLQASKWANVYKTTIRLVEDTRYVMSHVEIPKYIADERPDISRTWIWLLSLVQGMDALKRVTGLLTEEENENLHAVPFMLAHWLGNVSNLLVEGAFSVADPKGMKDATLCCSDIQGSDDGDTQRHAKVGRLSQESSACSISSRNSVSDCALPYSEVNFDRGSCLSVPSSVVWLILECLKAIESWLGPDTALRINSFSHNASSSGGGNSVTLRKKLFRIGKGANIKRLYRRSVSRIDTDELQVSSHTECHEKLGSSSIHATSGSLEVESGGVLDQNNTSTDASDITKLYPEDACMHGVSDYGLVELDSGTELDAFGILNFADWPEIVYDVSSQELSFHIPLHRLLSLLLRKAMRACYAETGKPDKVNGISALPSSGCHHDFFCKVLGGLQSCGFSAFVMEHPLRLRVFCAQVRAGMWRKNVDAAILSFGWYHSVQWLEQGLESDLFLLQCCAALAPPELFVKRIQERFGLSNYTFLNLADYNKYEPVLVQEMLTLIIQIVQERRFCGLSTTENLRRELVCKLAIGDATRSHLVKALPSDLSKSDQLQNVLDILAVYSNPSGLKQGKYSLRKAHWKELDLYHPRWNSKDLQAAEERYLRFCKVSALNVQLPRWTWVFEPLERISRIATSKAVLQIVRAVLFYALFTERSSMSRAPDGVLITALHLLSLALDVCEKQSQICIDKVDADVGMSHLDDQLCVNISHYTEDVFPILTCASEEFDAGATHESIIWKNQSVLSLLVSLMRKYKEESHSNYAETRQCNISSFIENLLKKFAQLSSDCMSDLKRLAPDVVCRMPHHSPNSTSQNLASGSDFEEQRAKARKRQAAILEKMKAEQSKFIASLKSAPSDEPDTSKSKQEVSSREDLVTEESRPVCSLCRDPESQSPLCFLIHLQKSRLTSFVERGPLSWEDVSQSDKDILSVRKEVLGDPSGFDSSSPVRLAQNAGLEFANDTEAAEVDAFLDFFKERLPDIGNIQLPNASYDTGTNSTLSLELMEHYIYQFVKGDVHDFLLHSDALDNEQKCSASHTAVGSMGSKNIASSVLGEDVASLSREPPRQHQRSMYDLLQIANISSRSTVPTAKFNGFGPRDCDGIHISSCGHAVHQECHDRYLLSLKQRNIRRLGFEVGHIVDPDMGELLCPVCRRFANSTLPAYPGVSNKAWRQQMSYAGSPTSYEMFSASSDMNNNILCLPLALSLLQSTSKMVGQGRFLQVFSRKLTETIEPALEPALQKLCMLYYPHNYGNLSASDRLCQSLILWDTLRYSLASTEIASRDKLKAGAVSSVSCLETLYGELHSSSGFILSLLLCVAQNTRSLNCLEVFLRFRGIQLLAGSICSGVSGENNFSNSDKRRGTFSSISEHADKGEAFPDIQFWKRAADPILAHDPFSSLMWVLFCLPLPFISSIEFFVPLVHLFYVVSVVQAMITCYSKQYFDISSFGDCLLNDVCKMMGESELAMEYFVSNYIDSSCHPKDMIRRLTFPYLRRCALLWKLLRSSSLTPLFDSSHTWEGSSPSTSNDAIDCTNNLTTELNGVRELEDMFQIHSLELVLKDKNVHALALKWCEHFCEFRARNFEGTLFSTPAVPFKLMQLPRVYQDLLQRYIKRQCSDCKSVQNEPALCLLCGRLCSPNWKSCCRESRCLNHAMVCGAGIGVFLLVRKTTILLQRSSRQSVWPSPYLDAFGEEDLDVYRGKPLYLSEERYATLTCLVASHGLDRSSEVLRQTTMSLYGSD